MGGGDGKQLSVDEAIIKQVVGWLWRDERRMNRIACERTRGRLASVDAVQVRSRSSFGGLAHVCVPHHRQRTEVTKVGLLGYRSEPLQWTDGPTVGGLSAGRR